MNATSFDALTRHAAGGPAISRRASLLSLAAAGLLALEPPLPAAGKKRGKKGKKSAAKLAAKKCKQQVGQCRSVTATCPDVPSCQVVAEVCCPILGSCNITEFLGCMQAAIT